MKLRAKKVEKPWGRLALPPPFGGSADGRRIGEIWFAAPDGAELPLLVKYIFTSEKLSVQVHPDDAQARARGLANGKSECWTIVDAEPEAALGLGLRQTAGRDALRAAALDGSIEDLIDWKPVRRGDFFYVPAGTVHAIGAGIALIEIQQPSDTTYRLYDYGRPRELHLEDGVAVARGEPYPAELAAHVEARSRTLVEGPHFRVEYVAGGGAVTALAERERFVLPVRGTVSAEGEAGEPGDCLLVPGGAELVASEDAELLVAAAA